MLAASCASIYSMRHTYAWLNCCLLPGGTICCLCEVFAVHVLRPLSMLGALLTPLSCCHSPCMYIAILTVCWSSKPILILLLYVVSLPMYTLQCVLEISIYGVFLTLASVVSFLVVLFTCVYVSLSMPTHICACYLNLPPYICLSSPFLLVWCLSIHIQTVQPCFTSLHAHFFIHTLFCLERLLSICTSHMLIPTSYIHCHGFSCLTNMPTSPLYLLSWFLIFHMLNPTAISS